jgi:hypothetical protein
MNSMLTRRESMMEQTEQERRSTRRFDMRLPAVVKLADNGPEELQTETQNVSACGVFFYLDRSLPQGTRIAVTLTLPPNITLTDPVRVRFTARVVRVEAPLPASRIGVAAVIEEYEFLRSSPGQDFLGSLGSQWKAS